MTSPAPERVARERPGRWFGVQINNAPGNTQRNFLFNVPRAVWITLLAVVLVAGGAFVVVRWVLPQFAPTYKTELLIDGTVEGVADIAGSVRSVVGNAGDRDALALRTFGGECGSSDNTERLVDFGTDNRDDLIKAVGAVRGRGQATLQRGILQAVDDFTRPFARSARRVNRIIVVTRHGVDACDSDSDFVEREVRDRVAAAGLKIEFRVIGYQVGADEHDRLARIADSPGAPEPAHVDNPADLDAALDWFTNVEPVLRNANRIIEILNPTVDRVNAAVEAIGQGRLDVAERTIGRARSAMDETDVEFDELRSRSGTPTGREISEHAGRLRAGQKAVVDSADAILDTARSSRPLGAKYTAFQDVARRYNEEADAMNTALAALRAKAPG